MIRRKHQCKMNSTVQEHNTRLSVMEEDVKESIHLLDLNILAANNQIHDEGVRLEKLKDILTEYTVQIQTESTSESRLPKKRNGRTPSYSRRAKG